jgi:hypothetical protein
MCKHPLKKHGWIDASKTNSLGEAEAKCNVAIVYEDVPAGQRAVRSLSYTEQALSEPTNFYPVLWRFDLLEDPDWRAWATKDARQADLLIISVSRPSNLSANVQAWIKDWLAQKQGTAAAVAVLFGVANSRAEPDLPPFQFVKSAAAEAGLDFLLPA